MANGNWHKVSVCGLALSGAVLAAACTSTAPSRLSSTQRAAIEGKYVLLQQPASSQFALISSSSTIAGALDPFTAGANSVKASKAGNTIVEQDHLVDPATVIGPALLAELVSTYGMKPIQGNGLPATSSRSTTPPTGADFVLSVEVSSWSTMYLLTSLSHYGVMLAARGKIVDGATAKVLREGRCIIRPRDQSDAPTFTELMENDGVRLRAEVDYATQACVEALKHSVVGE
jgi:hypothetical protein